MVRASGEKTLPKRWSDVAGLAAALGLLDGAAAGEVEELGLQAEVRLPELAVVDVFDGFPGAAWRRCAAASPTPRWRS